MFLVKCSCGCFFTVKPENLSKNPLQCPNCKKQIHLTDVSNVLESMPVLQGETVSVSYIPDSASFTVAFNP